MESFSADESDSLAWKRQHWPRVDSKTTAKADAGWLLIFWEGSQSHNLSDSCTIQKQEDEVIVLASSLAKTRESNRLLKRPTKCLPHWIMARDLVIINLTYYSCAPVAFSLTHSFSHLLFFLLCLCSQTEGVMLWPRCGSERNQTGIWL